MFTTSILPRLKDLFRTCRPLAARRRAPHVGRFSKPSSFRPRPEVLEDRTAPATVTWSGLGPTPNWSEASNWVGSVAPVGGDDLVFPAVALQKTNFNNLAGPGGTPFPVHSLTFSG